MMKSELEQIAEWLVVALELYAWDNPDDAADKCYSGRGCDPDHAEADWSEDGHSPDCNQVKEVLALYRKYREGCNEMCTCGKSRAECKATLCDGSGWFRPARHAMFDQEECPGCENCQSGEGEELLCLVCSKPGRCESCGECLECAALTAQECGEGWCPHCKLTGVQECDGALGDPGGGAPAREDGDSADATADLSTPAGEAASASHFGSAEEGA